MNVIGTDVIGTMTIGGVPTEEDNSIFRQKIAKKLESLPNFLGLVEEYPVHLGQTGGVIDILAKFKKGKSVLVFVIECKDYRKDKINFPKLPIPDEDKRTWRLYYRFKDKNDFFQHTLFSIKPRKAFYTPDISCNIKSSKKKKPFDFDTFHKWSLQISSNFMGFSVEEKKNRDTKTGNMEDMYILPLLVSSIDMDIPESIVVNPHPFTFPHLAVDEGQEYIDPIGRGELKKHCYIFVSETQLDTCIKNLLAEIK